MRKSAAVFLLALISVLSADVQFDSLAPGTWLRVPTLGEYPASGVDIHANCDTAGNMYILGGCTYGNAAGGTHNADVYRFDIKTGNTVQVYSDAENPVNLSCQNSQAYDKTRNCIWFSFGDLWTTGKGMFKFQCPDGPITKVSDTALIMGWRAPCYMYYDAAHDQLIAAQMYGLILRDNSTGDTQHVAYPETIDNSIYNVNELPSCFDTKRGLFAMTQWGGCWCAGGAEPVTPPLLNKMWLYNTNTGTWEVRSPSPNPGTNFSGEMTYDAVSDKYVYYGSGRLGYGLPEMWIYDYDTNTWTQVQRGTRTFNRADEAASTWPAQHFKHAWTFCGKYNVLVSWGGYNYIAAEAGVVFDPAVLDFYSGAHQSLWYYRIGNAAAAESGNPGNRAASLNLNAFPSPFGASVSIRLPGNAVMNPARLEIFNASGQRVADLTAAMQASGRNVVWNGTDAAQRRVPGGIYLCRFTSGATVLNRTVILAR